MDFHGALRARLTATPAVTALVAQRITWVDRPQAAALPAITLQTISQLRPQHMTGFSGLEISRVQIDCWATSSVAAQQIAEAVIAALASPVTSNLIRFDRAFVDSIRDLGERTDTAFVHRKSVDIIFHHSNV